MIPLGWPSQAAYEARLFGSHDFAFEVDVLDLNERPVGTAMMLDGEIQIVPADASGVRRTASITLSDPEGALDFATSAAFSGSSLWVNRLLRVTHVLQVGASEVRATCFVGVPTSISRDSAEVDVSLSDKAALANRGAPPLTVAKGANAVESIRRILSVRTGEFRFRLPTSRRRLSRSYSVGWADEASPWAVAAKIARRELGMQLLYAADGACLLRKVPSASSMTVPFVTAPASSSVDFGGLVNWVQVTGKTSEKRVGRQTIRTQPQAVAQMIASELGSPSSLSRKGVPRYLPLLVSDDALTTTRQVGDRAKAELAKGDRARVERQFSVPPIFHLDADDLLALAVDGPNEAVRLSQASIPLGVASDMTLGTNVPARRPPRVRSHVRMHKWRLTTRTVTKGRRKKTVKQRRKIQ